MNPERLVWKSTYIRFHFVHHDVGVEIFFEKEGQQNKWALILKYRFETPAVHLYSGLNKLSCRACLIFFVTENGSV